MDPKNTAKHESQHAKQIALRELKAAKNILGTGWNHVSDDVRWGLLCAGILGVIVGQHAIDNENATPGELAAVAIYAHELWKAAYTIRENGWR
jgi:hypothetical protein